MVLHAVETEHPTLGTSIVLNTGGPSNVLNPTKLYPTLFKYGEFSSCSTLKRDELPPNTLENSPEYFELTSDHWNVVQIV